MNENILISEFFKAPNQEFKKSFSKVKRLQSLILCVNLARPEYPNVWLHIIPDVLMKLFFFFPNEINI